MTKGEYEKAEDSFAEALTNAMVEAFDKVNIPLDELEWFCSRAEEIKEARYGACGAQKLLAE